jgi:CubicO group peptidase (beta-lactamase class C family)
MDRRTFMLASTALALAPRPARADNGPSTATFEEMGFAPDLGEKLDFGMRAGLLRNVHSVVVMRAGRLVLERYYEGSDHNGGQALGLVRFGAGTLHDLRSVTKSIVSLLYGIALERGQVPPPEAPLYEQFPDYADLADPTRAGILIEHALTMSIGLEWDETISYTDPANSEVMMERAPDRYRFILERPVVQPPGTRWRYSGGCTALLGRLLEKGTGQTLAAFAADVLFKPLGIATLTWRQGRDGVHSASGGLRLLPRDLAKIGQLVLQRGEWNGQRLVPETWIAGSIRPVLPTGDGLEYGRQWWLGTASVPALTGEQRWFAGFGNGGQRLWLMPAAELCCVVTAGNYNQPGNGAFPGRIWREIVLANLLKV